MLITYEKTFQGAWKLSTIHNGYLVTRQYFGHSKREAIKLFRAELKS